MRRTCLPAAILVLCLGSVRAQETKMPSGPWKELFNKKDFTGWSSLGNPPWTIVNGLINSKGGSNKNYLIWNEPIKDLELEIKYKLSSTKANSGIQVRSWCSDQSKTPPTCGNYVVCGPQLDVAMSYSGKLFEECKGFLSENGQGIDDCRRSLKVGEWVTTTARIDGPKVSLWLNNVHCLDYTLTNVAHLNNSIFAIQSHPPYDLIEWEFIRIRKLHIKGCTNPHAPNHNPEATDDDGTCQAVGLKMSRERVTRSVGTTGSRVAFEIPERSAYSVRLLDVRGSVAGTASGQGPVREGKLSLPKPGLYFLEIRASGRLTRHAIHFF